MSERQTRPALGARVRASAIMTRGKYEYDRNRYDIDEERWVAGPRWVRQERDVVGVYCGIKRLHQATRFWLESGVDADEEAYLSDDGLDGLITVYIVALNHRRRVNVLPGDVEVLP